MHEIGLVDDILCVINAKLKNSKEDSKVKRINILIGEMEHITADHFEFHFRERTKGNTLEKAELNFKKVKVRFKCRNCHSEFSADEGINGCPACNSRINDVIAGTGIHVESVELV